MYKLPNECHISVINLIGYYVFQIHKLKVYLNLNYYEIYIRKVLYEIN